MQNTSNDTKHKYKLILHSILILECDFHFNFNLKLNNVTDTTSFYTWPLALHAKSTMIIFTSGLLQGFT